MKHLKRILAFALTVVMAFGFTFSAYAAEGDLSVDAKVTVSGFEAGDTVTAYQFITWVDGTGWELADGITGITLDQITGGLDNNELATLASEANIAKMAPVTDGTTTGTTWEKACGTVATAGSYLVLIASNNVEHIYNPVVVSADFSGTNAAAVDLTQNAAKFKKQDITVDKKADNGIDDYDVQVGDIVPFTVEVTVPVYSNNWTTPRFVVTDTLSDGLTIATAPTIEGLTDGTDYTLNVNENNRGFTITFSETYLKQNASKNIAIKYTALVGDAVAANTQVHEETNTVTLDFSNNPSNTSDHKTVTDETHHYTFAIDANRLGQGSVKTNELIKVGVDENGNTITGELEGEELPTGVSPLAGAKFKLTGVGPNNEGTFELTATSDENGRIFFNNLEDGTYTLQETEAPAGYMKDQTSHTVVIDAEYNADTTLKEYTITIDGETTSTYTATTDATEPITYEAPTDGNPSFLIANTKGTELPSTGGIGTTIFYIVGGVMVVGAVVFLLTKRRMTAE
jgi:fimbrial isopeptide formation D2 family protein/LPXTG-motif cell wall-anchored protein